MKTNKHLLSAIALSIMTPAIVAPVPFQAEAASTKFKDVPTTNPYYDMILAMNQKGIIKGYQDGTFKPDQRITRQHAAALISRAVTLPKTVKAKTFKDVSSKHTYAKEIQALQTAGIIQPDAKGNFYPEKLLTRGEMAKILAVAFSMTSKGPAPLRDVTSKTPNKEAIEALYAYGITTGYKDGTFKPNETVSRAHYAVFMYRAMDYFNLLNSSPVEPAPTEKPIETTKPVQEETVPLSKLVTNEGPVELQKKLAGIRTDYAGVFRDDSLINTNWFNNNPISLKIYENGLDELQALGMYLYDSYEYTSDLLVTSNGYVNPTDRLGKAEVIFVGNGDKYGSFNFDFRQEKAEALTLAWLNIVFPQLAERLTPIVKEKAQDARVNLADPLHGNMEIIYIDGYEIQIGVNTFKEMFVLDIGEPRTFIEK